VQPIPEGFIRHPLLKANKDHPFSPHFLQITLFYSNGDPQSRFSLTKPFPPQTPCPPPQCYAWVKECYSTVRTPGGSFHIFVSPKTLPAHAIACIELPFVTRLTHGPKSSV
jgi:hypothetical protein